MRKLVVEQQLFFTQITELDNEIQQTLCYLDLPEYKNNNDVLRHEYLKNYLYLINEQIKLKCNHNYVTDDIDIDLEKSMKICFCTICEKCCNPVDSS